MRKSLGDFVKKEEILTKFPQVKDVIISKSYVALSIKTKIFRYEFNLWFPIFDYMYDEGYTLKVFENDLGKIIIVFEKVRK